MSVIRNRRLFTKEFKYRVIHETEAGKPLAQVARQNEIHPNPVAKWRTRLSVYGAEAFQGNAYTHEATVAGLERIIGQFAAENALLKRAWNLLPRANAGYTLG